MIRHLCLTLLACVLLFISCHDMENNNSSTININGNRMIDINWFRVSRGSFLISYKIKNVYDHNIWICDGISGVGKCDIKIEEKTLYLRLFSSLPHDKNLVYVIAPLAHYSRLSSNVSVERTIKIDLPIREDDLSFFSNRKAHRVNATQIVLQIGYLTEECLSILGGLAGRVSDGEIVVPIVRDVEVEEEILQVRISNVTIPVRPGLFPP